MKYYCLISIFLTTCLTACTPKKTTTDQSSPNTFGIVFLSELTEKEYFVSVNSLTEDTAPLPDQEAEIKSNVFSYHDGYYYGMGDEVASLIRYKPGQTAMVIDNVLSLEGIPLTFYSSWHNWLDDHTLLLGSTMEGRQFTYCLVDVQTMKVLKYGNFDIPLPAKPEYYGGIMAHYRDNRLFIAYTLYEGFGSPVPARDTTYMAVVDCPSMKTVDFQKDTRSTWPGGYFLHAPFSFEANRDIYFLTQPGGRTHNHPTAPTGIYRIKKGEQRLDPNYFFTVTDKKEQEGYLLYDLGKGKAIIKIVDKNRIDQYTDYLKKPVANYYVLDLLKQTKTKLELPLDRLDFLQNVLVDKDIAYIAISARNNESTIWQYNLTTEKLTKGISMAGRIYQLNRLR